MQHRPVLMATLLAGVAGWVDALGFYALAGVFTAHLTGNLVLLGEELVRGGSGMLPKMLVFPAFFAGVALAAVVHGHRKARGRSSVRAVLLTEAVAVAGFMLVGQASWLVADTADMGTLALLAVLLGAVAMGVQNAEGRLALRELGSTAVMTSNITQCVLDAVHALRARGPERTRHAQRARRQFLPIAAFSLGALVAAFAWRVAAFWGLLPPIAALVVLAALAD
jgi:uncharacterized membrane protein YoaK (UPF0700 family)